ncbi:hypothetical protein C8R45DRAFT_466085 [Mycena sanguinolenta]|nr:hypothetical protein C8R45DRAFT_466085 [Mycena sanguinolenta]
MDSFIKFLPRLRGRKHRCPPSAATKTPVKQPQNTILDEILDISKEARDALAANERAAMLHFEISFPPESPTPSHSGSSRSHTKTQEATAPQITSSPASSPSPSSLPLSAPPTGESALRDVPASGLGRRRNFKGRPIHTIPIPPMPTTPPPTPPTPPPRTSSSTRSLRRQPRFTDLNTASPISRCRTFPLSKDRTSPPPSLRNSVRLVRGSVAWRGVPAQDAEEQESTNTSTSSTTPPGSPTAVLVFPIPPLGTTFTKRTSVPGWVPDRATREASSIPIRESVASVEPLSIVKRGSTVTTHEGIPGSPSTIESSVMDELFSSLDDVYAQYHDAENASMVSIPLSNSAYDSAEGEDDVIEDLDGEVVWRTTYSLADEYASAFFPQMHFPPVPFPSSEATRPCPYSFLVERTQTLGKYHAEGSRSLPDLALRRSQDHVRRATEVPAGFFSHIHYSLSLLVSTTATTTLILYQKHVLKAARTCCPPELTGLHCKRKLQVS